MDKCSVLSKQLWQHITLAVNTHRPTLGRFQLGGRMGSFNPDSEPNGMPDAAPKQRQQLTASTVSH